MNKRKNKFIPGFLLGILAMGIVIGSIFGGIYIARKDVQKMSVADKTKNKTDTLKAMIDYYYLDDIDEEALENGVYKGLVYGLGDPYSQYFTAEEYQSFQEETEGSYLGIGAVVSQDEKSGMITVISTYDKSPAEKAGMKSGDIIYKVSGKEVTGNDLGDVVSKMKGKKGTTVKITVYRPGEDRYIDCTVTREKIHIPMVSYQMIDKKNKIGYIQIHQFEEVTENQFRSAVKDLKKQGMKSVIFDVRDNPGGLYTCVCEILDEILPEGTIVYTVDKKGKKQTQTSDKASLGLPIVVIQNENSASASEIFAGAIKDFDAGTIIGGQSYGKGLVQAVFALKDGSAVKLTIQKYFTPKGTDIHGKGITPDIEVEDDIKTKEDEAIVKAQKILSGEKEDENKKVKEKSETGKKSGKSSKHSKKSKDSNADKNSKSDKKSKKIKK